MIRLKSAEEIEMMRRAGRAVAEALAAMRDAIVPDVTTTLDLDEVAAEVLQKRGAKPALLGYKPSFSRVPYQHNTCISVNNEVVHGVPSKKRVLREGDLVSLDLDASIDGWCADAALTVPVGTVSAPAKNLLTVSREALFKGIAQARVGNTVEDIGTSSGAATTLCEIWSGTGAGGRHTKTRRSRIMAVRDAATSCGRA